MWKLSHKRRLTQEKLKSEEENGRLFFWFPGQEGIKKTLSKMESCLSPRQKIEGTETVRKRIIYLPLHLWRKWVESREEDLYRWEKDSRVVDTGKLLLCSNQYENIKMTLFMDPQKLLRQRQYHREKTSTEWGGNPAATKSCWEMSSNRFYEDQQN